MNPCGIGLAEVQVKPDKHDSPISFPSGNDDALVVLRIMERTSCRLLI